MGLFSCLCGTSEPPDRAYLPSSPAVVHVNPVHDKEQWLKEEKEQRARVAEAERDGASDSDGGESRRFMERHTSNAEDGAVRSKRDVEDICARTLPGEEYRRWDDHPVRNDYLILSSLGRGAFAEVALGMHKTTGKRAALKVVFLNKPGLKEKHLAILQREGNYLMKMAHRNIVKCSKIYRAPNQWVFVMEHLKGGMLLNDLSKLKRYSEKIAAVVFKQLLRATEYLHDNKIVHRDIKPENVVFKHSLAGSHNLHSSKSNVVKLVDFGMVLDLRKEPTARGMMGSPGFVAPEVILGGYHTTQMDMYSLGVLLFVMLVGAKPMTQEQAKTMQYAVMPLESLRGVHDPRWRVLTDAAKDMVINLLQLDPKARFTAKMALNHPWLKAAREESVLDGSVMEGWADPAQHMHAAAFMGNPFANHMGRSPMAGLTNMMAMQSPHGAHTPLGARSHTPRGGHTPHGGGRSGPFSNMHLLPSPMSNTGQHQNPFDPHSSVPISQAMYSLPGQSLPLNHRTLGSFEPMVTQWNPNLSDNTGAYSPGPAALASGPLASPHHTAPPGSINAALDIHARSNSLQAHSFGNLSNRAVAQAAHDQAIKKAQEAHAQVQRYLMTAQAIAAHPSAFASPHNHRASSAQVYDKLDSPGSQNTTPADNSGTPSALAHLNSGHTSTHFTTHGGGSGLRDESCNLTDPPPAAAPVPAPSTSAPLAAPKNSGSGEMVMSTAKIMDEAQNLMEELRQAPSLSANGELEAQLRLATQHLAAVQLAQKGAPLTDDLRSLAHLTQQPPRPRSGALPYGSALGGSLDPNHRGLMVPSDRIGGSLNSVPVGDHRSDGSRSAEMIPNPARNPVYADSEAGSNGSNPTQERPNSLSRSNSSNRTRNSWRKSKSQSKLNPVPLSILTKEIPRDHARDAYYASGSHGASVDLSSKQPRAPRSPLVDRTPGGGMKDSFRLNSAGRITRATSVPTEGTPPTDAL